MASKTPRDEGLRNERTSREEITTQYRDSSNLDARLALHDRFSANPTPWYRWAFDRLALPQDSRILELGCGTARLCTENADRLPAGWRITLTEASDGMLDAARENITLYFTYTLTRNFTFISTDTRGLPFGDEEFDVVVANHILYHVHHRSAVFGEVRRVPRPGGVFFAATNGRGNMAEIEPLRRIFNPEYSVGEAGNAFDLENGAEQLAPWFEEVSVEEREDELIVPESGPLVDYVLSTLDAQAAWRELSSEDLRKRVDLLEEHVEREIVESGALRISKSAGLFTARV